MVTTGDGPLNLRQHYTALAAAYINEHKQPGEAVGVAVEPARPHGWTAVVRIGDVGVRAGLGPDPTDGEIEAALAVLLEDARELAASGADMRAGLYRK